MRTVLALLICLALARNLWATVEYLDERGAVVSTTESSAALRQASGQVTKSVYSKRIIVLSEARETQIRIRHETETNTTRVTWVRLDEAVGELSNCLEQITGDQFTVGKEDAPVGIVLARADAPGLALAGLKALEGKGPEAFLIQSDGMNKLYLIGNSDLGIQHAVYTYLDLLGCRWFFAGDNWTIIPQRAGLGVKISVLSYPAFHSRSFFGSGGIDSLCHRYDPKAEATGRWKKWIERNRFGGSYTLRGHYYQDFINKNKALFQAHPEYRPEVKGKRVPFTKPEVMKLCYSNPDVIDLFVKDRVAACKDIIAKQAPTGIFPISVEPSDGYDHCECTNCVKLGSITDRVFSLANHVARAIRPLSPYAYVSLYAYNMHSPPPTIAIESNVIVQVAAYGFNTSGLPADQLIQAWGKKCDTLGVYDYWCIPQWGHDAPYLNFNDGYPKRVKFWYENKVRNFNLETTYSSGAVGPALYMVSRLGWEPEQDSDAIYEDFYAKAFGRARLPMQRMLERWASSWKLNQPEIADSFRDIDEALSLAADPAVKRRVNDYLGYVEYLRLRYEYLNTDRVKERPLWIERCRKLIHHLYRIQHSCFNHTVWTSGVLFWGTQGVNRPTNEEQLDVPVMRSSVPLSETELKTILREGRKNYAPVEYDRKVYTNADWVPLRPVIGLSSRTRTTPVLVGDGSHKTGVSFWWPEGVSNMTISVRFNDPPPTWDNFNIYNPKHDRTFGVTVPLDKADPGKWYDYVVTNAVSGLCGIRLLNDWRGAQLRFPDNVPVAIEASLARMRAGEIGVTNPPPETTVRVYFVAPPRLQVAAFTYPDAEALKQLEVRSLDGKAIPKTTQGATALFAVKGGDAPTPCELVLPSIGWWVNPIVPLNIPTMYSLFGDNPLVAQ